MFWYWFWLVLWSVANLFWASFSINCLRYSVLTDDDTETAVGGCMGVIVGLLTVVSIAAEAAVYLG